MGVWEYSEKGGIGIRAPVCEDVWGEEVGRGLTGAVGS